MLSASFVSTSLFALALQGPITVTDAEGTPLENAVLVRFTEPPNNSGAPQEHVMEQVNRQFSPQLVIAQQGDSVSFPNNDSVRHHVYSFSSPRVFEFELYSKGESPAIDFPQQGVVVVGCNIHDQMEGYIIIGSDQHALSNENGQLELPENFHHQDDWYIWHAWMLHSGKEPQTPEVIDGHIRLAVSSPPSARESELESRFQRRTLRGGH